MHGAAAKCNARLAHVVLYVGDLPVFLIGYEAGVN